MTNEPFYTPLNVLLPINGKCPHCGKVSGCMLRIETAHLKTSRIANFTCPSCKQKFSISAGLEVQIQVGRAEDFSFSVISEDPQ